MRPTARELAYRLSGTDDIRLLWYPRTDRLELSVRDVTTGGGFDLPVTAARALHAFHHPYAYAAAREGRAVMAALGEVSERSKERDWKSRTC